MEASHFSCLPSFPKRPSQSRNGESSKTDKEEDKTRPGESRKPSLKCAGNREVMDAGTSLDQQKDSR